MLMAPYNDGGLTWLISKLKTYVIYLWPPETGGDATLHATVFLKEFRACRCGRARITVVPSTTTVGKLF